MFKTRVELVGEIAQKQEADEALSGLRQSVTDRLFDEVAGMSLDNFIVRPKRRFVEKFQARNAWERLGPDERAELAEHIAGLPSAYEDDDLAAKQFDYLLLLAQLAVLRADPALVNHQARIMGIASQLEELANVPMVAAEMALILEMQTDEFWQDVNLPILENVRRRLRQLVKLIGPKDREIVCTEF